ncbi:hypothetical protein G3R49_00365 [Shewanella sp. WXL01]|uniref:DUF1795 domain-containing protein n=1 Tax=Shewanella maritima TaxID=2520507 RepID=A0A411PH50_9GAMM|nr:MULTISPECIES: hypothetical protein [Shewanella]NKF49028.1 hypothetical protein [Shewanella sp. WXL01]QBF82828.1 hypothetical protein EXU30_09085 [Shewanella maritima]
MKKIIGLVVMLMSWQAQALIQEITIDGSVSLPTMKVTVNTDREHTYWTMYESKGADFVSLSTLTKADAYKLRDIAAKAHDAYDEIKAINRCPKDDIKSGSLGQINSRSDRAWFQVVCRNNDIKLHIVMSDEYVINYVDVAVEANDFSKRVEALITELEKH